VNYGQATVNHHRIELYVLDATGRVAVAFTRLRWSVDAVVAAVRDAARSARGSLLRRLTPAAAAPAALVAAFVPHCPLCWSAYATAVGVPGLAIATPAWLHRGAWLLLGVNAIATVVAWRRSRASALTGVLTLVATSLLAVVATVPLLGSSRGVACVLLIGGVVLGLRRTRTTEPPCPGRA
jgi:protein SCO1